MGPTVGKNGLEMMVSDVCLGAETELSWNKSRNSVLGYKTKQEKYRPPDIVLYALILCIKIRGDRYLPHYYISQFVPHSETRLKVL